VKTGVRWLIIDAEPAEKGNIMVGLDPNTQEHTGLILYGRPLEDAREKSIDLYLDHHATCPDAAAWREKKRVSEQQGEMVL